MMTKHSDKTRYTNRTFQHGRTATYWVDPEQLGELSIAFICDGSWYNIEAARSYLDDRRSQWEQDHPGCRMLLLDGDDGRQSTYTVAFAHGAGCAR